MPDDQGVPIKVTVRDKRRVSEGGEDPSRGNPVTDVPADAASPDAPEERGSAEHGADYLDDLRRLQAEFENYRKRMMKEQAAIGTRARARLIGLLLPVLDDLVRAIDHGEGGEGVQLVYKQLRETLEREGLEEIPAAGRPFDPTEHEAVAVVEDPAENEAVCREVFRAGYRIDGQILRPAMVVVARPAQADDGDAGHASEVTHSGPESDPGEGG
ncbi:MAG: nucleotide exchange factor GrpE [Actinomycetota bacterium]